MPMQSCCVIQQGDEMKQILTVLVAIAVLSGCASHSNLGRQVDGMDAERIFGHSVATVLNCNDCHLR